MCLTSRICRYDITENSAPTPQKALASVIQSARWNSRIIEKGLGRSMPEDSAVGRERHRPIPRGQEQVSVRSPDVIRDVRLASRPNPGLHPGYDPYGDALPPIRPVKLATAATSSCGSIGLDHMDLVSRRAWARVRSSERANAVSAMAGVRPRTPAAKRRMSRIN